MTIKPFRSILDHRYIVADTHTCCFINFMHDQFRWQGTISRDELSKWYREVTWFEYLLVTGQSRSKCEEKLKIFIFKFKNTRRIRKSTRR